MNVPKNVAVWLESPAPHLTVADAQVERLRALLPGAAVALARSEDAFLAALPEADTAIVWRFAQDYFGRAPKLRRIATPAAGKDYFRVEPPPGVTLEYGTFHGPLIAETVVGMMLAAVRGLTRAARTMRAEDPWPRAQVGAGLRTLAGAHVAILGFGAIGRWIGRRLKPFDVRLTGVNRARLDRTDYFAKDDRVVSLDRLDEVLAEADHLVLAAPGGPQTDGLLDARRLGRMKPGAGVVNVGRGNILDEAALAAGLREGRLGYAALDVFAHEPLGADSPLWDAPNLLLLPHVSALAPDYLDRFVDEFVERCWMA